MITLLKSLAALLKEPRIAIFKTIIANFRCFPFRQAIHFPLFLYGNITFINEGHISLRPTYLTPGLIKLGKTDSIIWGSGGAIIPASSTKENGQSMVYSIWPMAVWLA